MPLFGSNIAALKEKHDLAGLLMVLKGNDARALRRLTRSMNSARGRWSQPSPRCC
jgi:hypothetical protein